MQPLSQTIFNIYINVTNISTIAFLGPWRLGGRFVRLKTWNICSTNLLYSRNLKKRPISPQGGDRKRWTKDTRPRTARAAKCPSAAFKRCRRRILQARLYPARKYSPISSPIPAPKTAPSFILARGAGMGLEFRSRLTKVNSINFEYYLIIDAFSKRWNYKTTSCDCRIG